MIKIKQIAQPDKIVSFLLQPYPFYYQGKLLWKIAGLLFVGTLLFNYVFEPFEVYAPEHKMNYFWISFIHAFNPVIILGVFSLFKISSKAEENWTVRKEIILIVVFLLLVGIAQFIVRDIIYDNPDNWSWRYLFEEIRNTFLIGTLFAIIFTSLNYNRLNTRNIKKAGELNLLHDLPQPTCNSMVLIETQVKNDDFSLNIDNLLFAKADGNYVEFYIVEEKINKVVKRITLKELQSLLKPFPSIIKTHRSYLVNLRHVNSVTGNAQGYKLRLNNYDEKVPVSRNMIQHFEAMVNRN